MITTFSKTPQRNLLDGFHIGDVTPEIKDKTEFIVETIIQPNGLHLVRGLSGDDYFRSRSRILGGKILGIGATAGTLPVATVAMAATKLEDPSGSVIYKGDPTNPRVDTYVSQEAKLNNSRLSLFGRAYDSAIQEHEPQITAARMRKLRTMKPGADKNFVTGEKAEQTCADLITRSGRLQRKSKLDEIPQFWDIAQGKLSYLGTRPIFQRELEGHLLREAMGGSKYRVLDYIHQTYNPLPKSPAGFVELVHHQELQNVDDYEWRVAADKTYHELGSLKLDLYAVPIFALESIKSAAGAKDKRLSTQYQLAA